MAPENTTVAVPRKRTFDDDALSQIHDYNELQSVVETAGILVRDVAQYGSGFVVLDDKSKLVKVPFVILDWNYSEGDKGEFVSIRAMLYAPILIDGRPEIKVVINDGGTGILRDMHKIDANLLRDKIIENEGDTVLLSVKRGLRVSEYDYEDDRGNKSKAKTYYLAF